MTVEKWTFTIGIIGLSLAIGLVFSYDRKAHEVTAQIVAERNQQVANAMDCPKLKGKQWLRLQVIHKGDIERLRIECYYGK